MTTGEVLFAALGLLTLAAAALAVGSRRMVHAALWLVVALAGVAGCYLVLSAELVALLQILVYLGAVVVLVIFALMLTRGSSDGEPVIDAPLPQRLAAGAVGAALAVLLAVALIAALGTERMPIASPDSATIAEAIFGTWVWPFELLSALLLAALVAGIALAQWSGRGDQAAAEGIGARAAAAHTHSGPDATPAPTSTPATDATPTTADGHGEAAAEAAAPAVATEQVPGPQQPTPAQDGGADS